MKSLKLLLCSLLTLPAALLGQTEDNRDSLMGLNLGFFWGSEWITTNVFRYTRPFIEVEQPWDWNGDPPASLDENGYPTAVTEGMRCKAVVGMGEYPNGDYTLYYDGEGTVEITQGPVVVSSEPGKIVFTYSNNVPGGLRYFHIDILETNAQDHVRNIRVFMPMDEWTEVPYDESHPDYPFHPLFLERLAPFKCIRPMAMTFTNGSLANNWDNRHTWNTVAWSNEGNRDAGPPYDGRYGGPPYEFFIALANKLQADYWVNMPHFADDAYMRNFAKLLAENLDPNLRVYIEYSNETWNSAPGFWQYYDIWDLGHEAGIPGTEGWQVVPKYTVQRSVQMFKIFEEVYGEDAMGRRVVRVLPTLTGDGWPTQDILFTELDENLEYVASGGTPAHAFADALAVAPYFSGDYNDDPPPTDTPWEDFFADLEEAMFRGPPEPRNMHWLSQTRKLLDDNSIDLDLICYESGQHLVDYSGGENARKAHIRAANRHPLMGDLYKTYYDFVRSQGVTLNCHYTSFAPYNEGETGTFGIMEYTDQDLATAPKYTATVEWNAENPYPWPAVLGAIRVLGFELRAADRAQLRWNLEVGREYRVRESGDLSVWADAAATVTEPGNFVAAADLSVGGAVFFYVDDHSEG